MEVDHDAVESGSQSDNEVEVTINVYNEDGNGGFDGYDAHDIVIGKLTEKKLFAWLESVSDPDLFSADGEDD